MLSLADVSRLKIRALGRKVRIYTYPGDRPCVSELSSWSDGAGGVTGQGGACHGAGTPVPLLHQHVCGFLAEPFGQERQQSVWFLRTIAGCRSIAAITLLCRWNSTTLFFSSWTSAQGFLSSCCVSCIAAHENPPLAIFATFKVSRMSDYSSCTRPPCLAIVADMLKTYKELVAASKVRFGYYLNHIRLHGLL